MEMGIGMKTLTPVDTAGAYVPSHPTTGFVTETPAFISRLKPVNDGQERRGSLLFSVNRMKNRASCWMLPILILICISFALSIPVIAVAQQVPPELREALEYHKAGKFKDAIEVYTEYLAKNPRSAEALNWRGMAYDDLGDTTRAMDDYNKAIQIRPDYADAYNNRGELYRKEKKYREALNDYRKATEFDKNFAEAFYNMGLVQEAEKRPDLAIQAYNAYLRLTPDASDKQQLTEKIDSLKKLVAQAPPKPGAAPGAAPKPGERPAPAKPGEKPAVAKPAMPKPGAMPGVAKPGAPAPVPPIPGFPMTPGESPIPGVSPEDFAKIMAVVMASFAIIGIVGLLFGIISMVMTFLIGKKTGTPLSWLAFIPIGITQLYVLVRASGKPLWWLALLLLWVILPPIAGLIDPSVASIVGLVTMLLAFVAWLFVSLGIAQSRGKSAVWGILFWLPCTHPIALLYLGLSK
jgi:tetratricopeptide (TPR) repeat protein